MLRRDDDPNVITCSGGEQRGGALEAAQASVDQAKAELDQLRAGAAKSDLAVAAAEMAFAGGFGARLDVAAIASEHGDAGPVIALFSESNTRFLCEVEPRNAGEFEGVMAKLPCARIGEVTAEDRFVVYLDDRRLIDASIGELKEAWQATFRW